MGEDVTFIVSKCSIETDDILQNPKYLDLLQRCDVIVLRWIVTEGRVQERCDGDGGVTHRQFHLGWRDSASIVAGQPQYAIRGVVSFTGQRDVYGVGALLALLLDGRMWLLK